MKHGLIVALAVVSGVVLPLSPLRGAGEDADVASLKRASKAFAGVASKAMPAVVFISVEKTVQAASPYGFYGDEFFERFFGGRGRSPREFLQQGQGSGFLISKDGYILTNNHVVGDADKIIVKLYDGRELVARRVGSDPKTEVAVIKIEGEGFPFLELGDSSVLEIGEWVIAVGNPFGLSATLTVGVVSAKGRSNMGIAEYEDFIQTDAAINPGNSGGPLLNIDGQAIGINTAIYSQSGGYMGIGFAVPINMAKAIKDQLMAGGKVTRGFLGVHLNREDLTSDLAASFGLDKAGGALVAEVVDESPAARAGIEEGDIVLKINGRPVKDNAAFRNEIAMLAPGSSVELLVFRDGKQRTLNVKVGTQEGEENTPARAREMAETIGLDVRDLTPELARRLGYGDAEGVLVESVKDGSLAAQAGLQPGLLVMSLNRVPVASVAEFNRELAKAQKGARLQLRVRNADYSWFVVLRLN